MQGKYPTEQNMDGNTVGWGNPQRGSVMRELMHALRALALLLLIAAILFIISQVAHVVSLAHAVHPLLGYFVLVAVLVAIALLVIFPIVRLFSLSPALSLPAETSGPKHSAYMQSLAARLRRNSLTRHLAISAADPASIDAALAILDRAATEKIVGIAKATFLSTALSQNGKLDAFIVLVAQARLIWRVACVYNQRPHPRELLRLYTNVGASVLAAAEFEDTELLETQLESLFVEILGQNLPMVNRFLSLVLGSATQGAGNALLTLRVGLIAKGYCAARSKADLSAIRRSAAIQTVPLFAGILKDCVARFGGAVLRAVKRTGVATAKAATQSAKANSARAVQDAADAGKKLSDIVTQVGSHVARRIGGVTQLGKDKLRLP